jgi:membrane protein YdbS with pleckstrin-like domain
MRRRRFLREGEEVVVEVRPHWWYLAGPVAVLVAVIAGSIYGWLRSMPSYAAWAAVAALGVSALWLVGRYASWASTRLIVTNSRVLERKGVLGRRGREIPVAAVTNIEYRQSLFERLVGNGDVVLESAGRDGQEVFSDLPHPAAVHNDIWAQAEAWRRRVGAPAATASIPEQIDQLDQLRRRGVITESEFQAKKAQLLDRL